MSLNFKSLFLAQYSCGSTFIVNLSPACFYMHVPKTPHVYWVKNKNLLLPKTREECDRTNKVDFQGTALRSYKVLFSI